MSTLEETEQAMWLLSGGQSFPGPAKRQKSKYLQAKVGLCTLGTTRRLRWLELRKHEENRTEGGESQRDDGQRVAGKR